MEFSKKVFMLNQSVEEFLDKEITIEKSGLVIPKKWSPPVAGWLKANTDASFSICRAGLEMVIRNEVGELVILKSKVVESFSA